MVMCYVLCVNCKKSSALSLWTGMRTDRIFDAPDSHRDSHLVQMLAYLDNVFTVLTELSPPQQERRLIDVIANEKLLH